MYGPKRLVFLIVSWRGNLDMHGPKHLVFQLFGEVGIWICMDLSIEFYNCSVGEVGNLDIRGYIQTFSFSIVWGSGNFDMYGSKHLVCQLSGGV